jgi:hypothetical protein
LKRRRRKLILMFALAAALVAPAAFATSEEDFGNVFRDWRADGDIRPCRWTVEELRNARREALDYPDFEAYGAGFVPEIDRELARWRRRSCRGVDRPTEAREESALLGVRIIRVRPRGRARRESLTLKNFSDRRVNLRRATLRDKSGKRIRFPRRGFRLRPGRRVRVVTGCPRRRPRPRRPVRRGRKLYGCKRGQVWNDRNDVARLKDRNGVTVSQRGYGRYRRFPRF